MNEKRRSPLQQKAKVGILVALPRELSTLTRTRLQPGSSVALAKNTVIYLTGMGKKNAQENANKAISEGATSLISWGTATALSEDLHPGTLGIPDVIITAQRKKMAANTHLINIIKEQLNDHVVIYSSALAEAATILTSVEDKMKLRKQTNAKIADMESSAILKIANKKDVPFVAIRAIADAYHSVIPAAVTKASSRGVIDISTLAYQLVKRPADWPAIMSLAFSFRKARHTLRETAQILVPFLIENGINKVNE